MTYDVNVAVELACDNAWLRQRFNEIVADIRDHIMTTHDVLNADLDPNEDDVEMHDQLSRLINLESRIGRAWTPRMVLNALQEERDLIEGLFTGFDYDVTQELNRLVDQGLGLR